MLHHLLLTLLVTSSVLGLEYCCKEKTVGPASYSLKRTMDGAGETMEKFGCITDCVYERDGQEFCFAPGDLEPQCLEGVKSFLIG